MKMTPLVIAGVRDDQNAIWKEKAPMAIPGKTRSEP